MKWLKMPIISSKSTKMHTSGSVNPWVLILQSPDVVAACFVAVESYGDPEGATGADAFQGSRRMELYVSVVPLVFHR